MSVISRAVFICNQLALKLEDREVELQNLDNRRKIKRFFPDALEDDPSLLTCLAHAEKTVKAIRETDERILVVREEKAMTMLENFAEEFNVPEEGEEEEEEED